MWKEANPNREKGTCLWCGEVLEKIRTQTVIEEQEVPACSSLSFRTTIQTRTVEVERVIPSIDARWDVHFCSSNCGYQFGVALADDGMRLA